VVQLVLSSGAQTGAAVADEDLFALVFLFQEVVEAHRTERDGIAKEVILTHLADEVILFGGAVFFGGIDHAFEDVFFDAFAEGEGAEVFGHGGLQRLNAHFTNRFAESNA
jgi:hypothetical protein